MTRKDLHRVSGVSQATLAKMSRGESVTASVLERICNSLDCKIENVMEVTPDKSSNSTTVCVPRDSDVGENPEKASSHA